MMDIPNIIETVQGNCNIADARHAREMTLCNYLLGMRELYRWEQELPLSQPLSKVDVGSWLSQREESWEAVETSNFRPISIGGTYFDPFDSEAINQMLLPHGLVYGGGYGHWGHPEFFFAQLARSENRSGLRVLVSGCEYARGMAAPPAVLNNGTVYLRTDAMQRWLWSKFEIWGVHKPDDAMSAALAYYEDCGAEKQLECMAARESETLILHEVGEALAEQKLGPAWREMVGAIADRRAELLVRAIRDNLADCLSTIPELIRRGESGSIHFYFANFDGMRLKLFPFLMKSYENWRSSGSDWDMVAAATAGSSHWLVNAIQLLEAWQRDPLGGEVAIVELSEHSAALVL